MPAAALVNEFERTRGAWEVLGEALVPLIERLAVETVGDALPGAAAIEVHGEINEDWLRVLRIRRVLSAEGDVLFDVANGHDDRRVEDAIDMIDADYLDLLMDLTGDLYLGNHLLDAVPNA